ncbi:MAG: histidine phosphatase family protein [Pseudomonadota bacterium]|nr:histidine phosphatase family protein [Pseudomonadota bacterium]
MGLAPGEAREDDPPFPGAVILARHGEPALSRKIRLSSAGYRAWWAAYEAGGIKPGQIIPAPLRSTAKGAGHLICSTRPRSMETAAALACGRAFEEDARFIEAPLPPPALPGWIRFSPRHWGVIARFWWWVFNHHQGEETRGAARIRADAAAGRLIDLAAGGEDVLVVAHGFFNGMVGGALKRKGWRCTLDQGYRYWSARRFEAPPTSR